MTVSIFQLFSIGIGPSSSHTVGPMRAAYQFVHLLEEENLLSITARVKIELYGSLALTGKGHSTDIAVLLGLEGEIPAKIDPAIIQPRVAAIREQKTLELLHKKNIAFVEQDDLLFHKDKTMPFHSNGMCFTAYDEHEQILISRVYYSIGGGFIVDQENFNKPVLNEAEPEVPYPFITAAELLAHCRAQNCTIADIMLKNECTWRSEKEIKEKLLEIWQVMLACIERGCNTPGMLPGILNVKRRAADLYKKIQAQIAAGEPVQDVNWLSLYAIAVNEENAAGSRVVTAPTNGAAGTIPSVLNYYLTHYPNANEEGILQFLLTAGAIGILYKEGASISAAEVGCQGEIGVACSMAAGGLTAALGGTIEQVENAAEIGMEHNLGLTCDPIGGLVQIPCIERNAVGAAHAVTAAHLALFGDGSHKVSLDEVIATMRQTGRDMLTKYKETSQGGLAVNVPEC
jgi:L-serine dehydratase